MGHQDQYSLAESGTEVRGSESHECDIRLSSMYHLNNQDVRLTTRSVNTSSADLASLSGSNASTSLALSA